MMNSWVKLKDIAHVLNGYAFKSNNYVQNGIRIIRITNVQKGYIEDNDPKFYPIEALEEVKGFRLYENDLLMSLTGNVGRVALLRKEMLPAALNQRVACIRIKEGAQVKKEFLYHFMNSDLFELKCIESANGVAQKNLSTEWLKEFRLYLPSIEKQGIITKVLDHLSDLITREKQQLKDLDLLIKSRFIEMFEGKDYPQKRLSDVCNKITDGTHKTPIYLNEGVVFISAKNIIDGKLNFEDIKYISEEEYQGIQKRCQIEKGDVLLTKSGSLGMTAIVETDEPLGLFESLAVLKYNRSLLKGIFLCTQMQSDAIQTQLMSNIKGVAVKHLHLNVISSTKVIVPPLDVQESFSLFVAQVDKSKLAVQQSLNELETLKKSLMQQYFG